MIHRLTGYVGISKEILKIEFCRWPPEKIEIYLLDGSESRLLLNLRHFFSEFINLNFHMARKSYQAFVANLELLSNYIYEFLNIFVAKYLFIGHIKNSWSKSASDLVKSTILPFKGVNLSFLMVPWQNSVCLTFFLTFLRKLVHEFAQKVPQIK